MRCRSMVSDRGSRGNGTLLGALTGFAEGRDLLAADGPQLLEDRLLVLVDRADDIVERLACRGLQVPSISSRQTAQTG